MTKATPKVGGLPNGSIDFEKVQAAAKAGKDDVFKGAVTKQRGEVKPEEQAAAATEQSAASTGEK